MNRDDLIGALKEIFPSGTWPKPLHILQALSLTNSGSPFRDAAKSVGTTHASVLAASQTGDPVRAVLGLALNEIEERSRERAGQMFGATSSRALRGDRLRANIQVGNAFGRVRTARPA